MIGKQVLKIDVDDFLKGMSSSANTTDGGFTNETDCVNLSANPGVIYAPASMVNADIDARLTGGIIASCPDMAIIGVDARLLVGSNDTFYRYDGTKIIAAAYTGGTASTYASGFNDIITYRGEAYVTAKERIKRWQNNNTITDLASFTTTNVPHPALVYENNAYYGDANLLLQATAVNTAPTTILTLDANQIIIALGIDSGTGLMLISTTTSLNVSDTLNSINKVLWYDGNSLKVVKSIIVEDQVLAFHSHGGTTFVGYGQNIGYMNGSGIAFLRKLKNVTLNNDELPYKHHFASIGSALCVADGKQILEFEEIIRGQKIFYYSQSNTVNTNKYTCIFNAGSGKIGLAFATTKFYTVDTTSVATSAGMNFWTLDYAFLRPVYLRSAYLEYQDGVVNNDDNRSLTAKIHDQTTTLLRVEGQTGTSGIKNTSGGTVYFIDNIVGFPTIKAKSLQLRYINSTVNTGLKRILIYYDYAE